MIWSRIALSFWVVLIASAVPARAQFVDGEIELTYDPGTQTLEVYANTEIDIDMADEYNASVSVSVLMNNSLAYYAKRTNSDDDTEFDTEIEIDDEIPAYPGVVYTGKATHSLVYTVTDPVFSKTIFYSWDDPYGFERLGFSDAGNPSVNVFPSYPYSYSFANHSGRDVARTTAKPVLTPPAALTINVNGVALVSGGQVTGVNSSNHCPTSNPAADGAPGVCALFQPTPGDPTETPQVPGLVSSLSGVNPSLPVSWSSNLSYLRSDSGVVPNTQMSKPCNREGRGIPQPYADGITGSSSSLGGADSYDINSSLGLSRPGSSGTVQGGVLTLSWVVGTVTQSYTIGLWGKDPSLGAMQSRLAGEAPPWWGSNIISWESKWHQFNIEDGIAGTPNFGGPCGFGLGQTDPPRRIADVWNWQSNLDTARQVMSEKYALGVKQWEATMRKYTSDSAANQQANVPPCKYVIGNPPVTFCVNEAQGKSFADANSIKCYNGCTYPFLDYSGPDGKWIYSNYSAASGNYVDHVLSAPVPKP